MGIKNKPEHLPRLFPFILNEYKINKNIYESLVILRIVFYTQWVYNNNCQKELNTNEHTTKEIKTMRKYYGWNYDENRTMLATVTGEMFNGMLVYTECDGNGKLINIDKQYYRTLKQGTQCFFKI